MGKDFEEEYVSFLYDIADALGIETGLATFWDVDRKKQKEMVLMRATKLHGIFKKDLEKNDK